MQKIKLNIGNRIYPLSVDSSQEEVLRKASKKINEMINDYESKYAVKDKQDSLAMCALQILSQSNIFIKSDEKNTSEIEDKIEEIKNLIDSRLNNAH
jgi:cell division protein ZapA